MCTVDKTADADVIESNREPQSDRAMLSRPLGWITSLVVRYPAATLALGVAVAALAMMLTVSRLGFRTSRLDLLNPESDYNRLWIDYINEFGDDDDAVIVVEGQSREQLVPVLEEISAALGQQQQLFHAVLHEVDLSRIRAKGLHYLPIGELQEIERFLIHVEPIIRGDWSRLNLGRMINTQREQFLADDNRYGELSTPGEFVELEQLTDALASMLGDAPRYQTPWPEISASIATLSDLGAEYMLTNNGKLGFVLLRLAKTEGGFSSCSEAVDSLRDVLLHVSTRHPGIHIGLTGLPVMENDEMRASQSSMINASGLSLLGVACLFVAGFGGIRYPLMTMVSLLMGMAWSFGYITLGVGHLNILSVSFTVILIGLGIDFGVHYVARYQQILRSRRNANEALVLTARTVGPGVITGALTTAIAFFTAALTEFTGIAELGIIAGGGILLCALAAVLVLPAMLAMVDRRSAGRDHPDPLPVDQWIAPLMRSPRMLLAVSLVFTIVVGFGVRRLRYDHNLLNLQPIGLQSVELERKLLAEGDQSVWFALSIAENREELLARKARFLKLDSVERTEEIVSLLPTDHETKQPIIQRIARRLDDLPERPPLIPADHPDDLGRVLAQAQQTVERSSRGGRCARQIEHVRDMLRRLPAAECSARLSSYQQQMAGDFLSRLHALRAMAVPEPPDISDLPASLVHRFVGQHGRHLLKIYARGNIWDMQALEQFVHDVRSVDPRATGNPLQTYEASLQMKNSYQEAAIYSLIAIVIVLVIDFRMLRHVLLATLPVGVGTLQMFGLLGVLDIPLNPANMIVLPLILGIGIDDGVHILHDYRCQQGPYHISRSTATSVLITSLTTMVGFGSLMIASHRGLRSLGQVLSIGVACCLFTSLVMLPALLTWISRHRQEIDDEPQGPFDAKRPGTPVTRRYDDQHDPGPRPPVGHPAHRETVGWR